MYLAVLYIMTSVEKKEYFVVIIVVIIVIIVFWKLQSNLRFICNLFSLYWNIVSLKTVKLFWMNQSALSLKNILYITRIYISLKIPGNNSYNWHQVYSNMVYIDNDLNTAILIQPNLPFLCGRMQLPWWKSLKITCNVNYGVTKESLWFQLL